MKHSIELTRYKPLDLRLTEALRAYLKSHEMDSETPWQQKLRDRIKFFLDHAEGK